MSYFSSTTCFRGIIGFIDITTTEKDIDVLNIVFSAVFIDTPFSINFIVWRMHTYKRTPSNLSISYNGVFPAARSRTRGRVLGRDFDGVYIQRY